MSEGIMFPETEATGDCELSVMGTRNIIGVF